MKNLATALFALLFTFSASQAQETQETPATVEPGGVEQSIGNAQAGLFGAWVSYEGRLSNTLAIRAEGGLDAGFYYTYLTKETVFMAGPSINLEPRWYYNIKKRAAKGRNTANNSANFIGLSVKYLPDWFTLSNDKFYNIADQVLIVPKWSIRRHIGSSNFNYEAGIGIGYQYVFLKQYGYLENASEAYMDLHVRVGYTF